MRLFSSGIVKSPELDWAMPRKRFLKDAPLRSLEHGIDTPGSEFSENADRDFARRDLDDELPELDPALCNVLLASKRGGPGGIGR
jgi:hypothetical protein